LLQHGDACFVVLRSFFGATESFFGKNAFLIEAFKDFSHMVETTVDVVFEFDHFLFENNHFLFENIKFSFESMEFAACDGGVWVVVL